MPANIVLYSKPGCHLCEDVERKVLEVRASVPFDLSIVDITTDPALQSRHGFDIPVVTVNGETYSTHFLNAHAFEKFVKEVNA